jgi:hypothetical protein
MDQEAALELSLLIVIRQRQEIEIVRIAQDLLRHVGAFRRQSALEVGDRLPFPLMDSALNHMDQDVAAPALLNCSAEIP